MGVIVREFFHTSALYFLFLIRLSVERLTDFDLKTSMSALPFSMMNHSLQAQPSSILPGKSSRSNQQNLHLIVG